MKKLVFLISIICMCHILQAQFNSSDGKGITPTGTYRTLNIFINIIYDLNPSANPFPNNDTAWPYTTIEGVTTTGPTYFTNYIDVNYTTPANVHGTITRIYHESSFGRLILLGDMVVVNIKQSSIDPNGGSFSSGELIAACNSMIDVLGVNTTYGHNSISDYDNNSDNIVDFVQYFCRNGTATFGLDIPKGGFTSRGGSLTFSGTPRDIAFFSFQKAENGDISKDYKHLSIHEFAHNLFGSNAFHTSGGNHYVWPGTACTFMGLQGGWGLMGAANSSLTTCNAFERWRINWTSATYNPTAIRIQANGTNSDIDNTSGRKVFYLRDFVSTGDAVRIKLPYKDNTTSSNQYIWLENHQIGTNGKLDFFRFKDYVNCFTQGTPGVYAYYQVGKDVLSGTTSGVVWPNNETDNLRVISAEGNWDMIFDGNQNDCPNWANRVVVKQIAENRLSGYNDQETVLYNTSSNTLIANANAFYIYVKKLINNTINGALPLHGDNNDAFTTNKKIGIATNPSSANTVTYYADQDSGNIIPNNAIKNTRKIYLSGLQILFEASGTNQFGSIFKVTIDWDKFDLNNDMRWTGNIVLKESAILKQSKSLLFNQNKTPNMETRSTATGQFSDATLFTCENNSRFTMEANSIVTLDEKSTFILKSGSTLEINDGAKFIVKNGSKLEVESGATILIKGTGSIIMKCLGTICVNSGAILNLQDFTSCIHFIGNGALASGCLSSLTSVITGKGSVQNHKSALNLTSSTISSDIYYSGTTITSTNVIIQGTGTDVVYDATNGVTINGNFDVPIGSTFEVKSSSTSCTN